MTTDQFTDQTAEGSQATQLPSAFTAAQVDTILDLDAMLESAKRAERLFDVSLLGDIARKQQDVLTELAMYAEVQGRDLDETVDADEGLNEVPRVAELEQLAKEYDEQLTKGPRLKVLFRALPSDEWEAFDKAHRTGANDRVKNQRAYENEAIALSAVAPPLTVEQIETKIRKTLGNAQMQQMIADAFWVNNRDGISVPKLPNSLRGPRPQELGTS